MYEKSWNLYDRKIMNIFYLGWVAKIMQCNVTINMLEHKIIKNYNATLPHKIISHKNI